MDYNNIQDKIRDRIRDRVITFRGRIKSMANSTTFTADNDYVKVLGRTMLRDGVRILRYSCTAIEFEFTGTKAEAVLWTNLPIPNEENRVWVAVFVNDEKVPSKRFPLEKEEDIYLLYQGGQPQITRIRLVKYSEAHTGMVGIKSITIDTDMAPAPTSYKDRKIEFVGDSITCGFGNEGICDVDDFKTSQENPWEAYAAKSARALDADYHLISWSGIGVLSNYTELDEPKDDWLMPDLYPYTDKTTDLYYKSAKIEEWDSNRFTPDCIIINLGTNDCSYTKNLSERVEAFGTVYYQFVKNIRTKNPNAKILCTLGAMGQELYPVIERLVNQLNLEGDDKIYAMPFEVQLEKDGIGTYWHPSLITHEKMAIRLTAKVKEIMNW